MDRVDRPSPAGGCAHPILLATVALIAVAAVLVLLARTASGDGGTNLTLESVVFAALDTDSDGLADSVRINATVRNADPERSEPFTALATVSNASLEVDAQTAAGLLAANTSQNVSLLVGTEDTSAHGTYKLAIELHAGDLLGPIAGREEQDLELYPKGDYMLVLEVNRTSVVALENESVAFTATVTSSSNNPTDVELSTQTTLGWPVELVPTALALAGGQGKPVSVTVRIPHNAPPGSLERVVLIATAVRNRAATASASVSVQVPIQVYDVRLEVADPTGQLSSGQTLDFVGIVHNLGNSADNITLEYDAPLGWKVAIVPSHALLDRGTSAPVEVHVTAPATLVGSGTAIVNVTARSQGLTTFSRQPIALTYNSPELSIEAGNVTVTPRSPYAGDVVAVEARVLNTGSGPAEGLVVELLVDGVPAGRATIPFAAVGERTAATLRWTATPGLHRLTVRVDPDNAFGEVIEHDNEASVQVDVTSPDLAISTSDLSLSPPYPTVGEAADLSIVVHNRQKAPAGPFNVSIAIDGAAVRTLPVDGGLAGYANVSLTYAWTAVNGRHAFKVEVDPGNATYEQDEGNNAATRSFTANSRPTAVLALPSDTEKEGVAVSLVGSGSYDPDGRVRQYFFDYGDGSNSGWAFTSNVTHTYKGKGQYQLKLYVRDEVGAESVLPAVANLTVKEKGTVKEPTPAPGAAIAAGALAVSALVAVAAAGARAGRRGGGRGA
jgi:hypothetical protein